MSNMNSLREDGFVWYMVLEGAVHSVWPCAVRKKTSWQQAHMTELFFPIFVIKKQTKGRQEEARDKQLPTTPSDELSLSMSHLLNFPRPSKNHGIDLWPRLTKFAGDISCLNHNSTSLSGFCMFASWDHLLSELLSASWSQFLYLGESNPANQISINRGII